MEAVLSEPEAKRGTWGPAALEKRRERTRNHLAKLAVRRESWKPRSFAQRVEPSSQRSDAPRESPRRPFHPRKSHLGGLAHEALVCVNKSNIKTHGSTRICSSPSVFIRVHSWLNLRLGVWLVAAVGGVACKSQPTRLPLRKSPKEI